MDDEAKQTAYFRFGIISPLPSHDPEHTRAARLSEQSEKTWQWLDGQPRAHVSSVGRWCPGCGRSILLRFGIAFWLPRSWKLRPL